MIKQTKITKEHVITELIRLKNELGRLPAIKDLGKNGNVGIKTIVRLYGGWNKALIEIFGKVNCLHSKDGGKTLICPMCNLEFFCITAEINRYKNNFCSKECNGKYYSIIYSDKKKTGKIVKCSGCEDTFYRKPRDLKRNKYHYCSNKCKNEHHGDYLKLKSVSKIELFIRQKLTELYPNLNISYNDRKILGGLELDIYIPSLKLAFEINGIHHYKPIYGNERFEKTQYNDTQKVLLCITKNITLYSIDAYTRYALKNSLDIFLNEIVEKINILIPKLENDSRTLPEKAVALTQ